MPNGTATPEERIGSWVEQLERIEQQTYGMHHYRALWRDLAEITSAANLPPSVFFDALNHWYPAVQASAVRRQVDTTAGTVSLVRLLRQINSHRGAMTRERHVALWVGHDPKPVIDHGDGWTWTPFLEEANANFDRFSGARDRDTISREVIEGDIAALMAAGQSVVVYVNDLIAHTALNPREIELTYADLNAAIDTVGELLTKYTSFLKASTHMTLEPTIQQDWTAIFRQAWIR